MSTNERGQHRPPFPVPTPSTESPDLESKIYEDSHRDGVVSGSEDSENAVVPEAEEASLTPDEECAMMEERPDQQAEAEPMPRPPQPCPACHKQTTWILRGNHVVCCYCGGKVVCSPP